MALGKRLINTGVAEAACLTETTDIFGDSSGVALYNLDSDASTAPDGTDYSGTPTNVDFGVGGQVNYGASFNGSTSIIDTNIVSLADSYTLSFWINPVNVSPTNWYQVIGGDDGSGNKNYDRFVAIGLEGSGTGTIGFLVNTGGTYIYSDNNLTANTWTHVVCIKDGTTSRMYINGEEQADTATVPATITYQGSLTLGKFYGNTTRSLEGSLDQVRIFSKALSQSEVDTLYAETACVYDSTTDIVDFPNLKTNKAYIPFDNSAEDLVSGDFGTIASGMDFKFGRYGQAIRTTANAHFVDFPNISESPNSPFSYSCWANITDINQRVYLFFWATASGATSAWGGILNGVGGKPHFNFCNNAATASTFTVPQKQWFHYVATYDGTTAKAYVDNQLVLTANISTANLATNNLRILDTITDTEAMIDQVRVYDSVLDTDDIDKLYNEKPEVDTSNFKAVLWEGNNTTGHFINNVGMDLETNGGLVWIKARTDTDNHIWQDNVRGITNYIMSSSNLQQFNSDMVVSLEKTGFVLGADTPTAVNTNNIDFVSWVWKGGGDAVSNTNGSITSQVSANTEAGFSIVKYTGNSTTGATVGHGLSSAPDLIIVKLLDATKDWYVFSELLGQSGGEYQYLELNTTDAATTFATQEVWNGDLPTSDLFTLTGGSADNLNNNDYIAYCFHSVAGYSKIGTYSGDGNPNHEITDVGFQPNFLLIKNTGNSGTDWLMYDNRRGTTALAPNQSFAESTYSNSYEIEFISNGFKIIDSNNATNESGTDNFIYMAFK